MACRTRPLTARARVHHSLVGRRAGVGLWCLAVAGPVLVAASTVGAVRSGQQLTDFANAYPNLVLGALMPLLGALILARVPRHPVGAIFLVSGLASAVATGVYGYAEYGLVDHPGSLPLAVLAGWVSSWVWTLGFVPLVTLGVLYFPDGRLPSPRWRALAVGDATGIGLLVLTNAFAPGPLQNQPVVDNPLGASALEGVEPVVQGVALALVVLGMLGGVGSAVVRWRRASGVVRTQLGWLALAVTLLLASTLPPWPGAVATVLVAVAVPLFPIAVAATIVRGRVYGHELAVRRSLVYATLVGLLLLAYAVAVTTVGLLLRDPSAPVASLVGAATVAVVLAPLQDRLRRGADRLVYGDTGEPYLVLAAVGRRVAGSSEAAPEPVTELAATVAASLRVPYVRVHVGRADDAEAGAGAHGAREGGPAGRDGLHGQPRGQTHTTPLTFGDEVVGRLEVSDRGPADPLRAADLRLLDDIARQLGVAARALLLGADLQRSRQDLVTAREEERRRLRRDLHDGLGPALAGLALGLDGLARTATTDPTGAASLAGHLGGEVRDALADVRRLVDGLRPPELDHLGLLPAVERQARLLSERVPGLEVGVEASAMPAVSAAGEVAAYRIVAEALTNVHRHAEARWCRVRLDGEASGGLVVEVEDDGCGLSAGRGRGMGLGAMRERATELGGTFDVEPVAPHGTRVRAWIPMAP